MRSLREIKKSIGQARIESKPQADRAVLRHLLAEWATVKGSAPHPLGEHHGRTIPARRVLQALAAAAVVILALVLTARSPQRTPPPTERRVQSAADLLTVGCLNAACRRGGFEELDRQCEEAARRLNTGAQRTSVQELIRELQETSASKG